MQLLTPLAFAQAHIGARLTAPGGLGGQCVDLANLWLVESRGQDAVHLNAVDWAWARIRGLKWVPNSPVNAPPLGALVVWGQDARTHVGVFGHIALALSSDPMAFVSLDQNWKAQVAALVLHSYDGVLGWHVPG